MDFSFSPQEEAFRQRVRTFLKENLPPGWGTPAFQMPKEPRKAWELRRDWERKLYDGGFGGLSWPKDYGGQGASYVEQVIFQEELARVQAPPGVNGLGTGVAGPAIMHHGSEEMKKRYLPPMLRCDEVWCQGFSEPNAGSDLAGLQTRAERAGDHYVVNGQKVWTSGGMYADLMFLLARTNPSAPKHKGISAFVMDMKSPGLTVRPLKQITGSSEFCEEFFDNVRIPVENRIGEEGQGWEIAMTALGYERGAGAFARAVTMEMECSRLIELARGLRRGGMRLTEHPHYRQRLAQAYIEIQVIKFQALRALTRMIRGEGPGPAGATSKLWYSETHYRLTDLAMEILGPGHQLAAMNGQEDEGRASGSWQYRFLWSRAETIFSGTSEIQRNIVAERILGMPRV